MPIDLRPDPSSTPCSVIDRRGHALPFSKGILATSVLATGIQTPRAYEVARIVHEYLERNGIKEINSADLTALTTENIRSLVSEQVAESYLLWRRARRIGRPIVISMLGSSGVGKSTLATRLALRLGINRVVTTDAIREVLRTVVPVPVLPELHVSSYEAIDSDSKDAPDATYHRQSRAVVSACAAVARRYVSEKKNVLFEGVHLLPGYLTKELDGMDEKPIVVELLLALGDEELHNARLMRRLVTEPGREGERHLNRFDVIRDLQNSMQALAGKAGIPELDVGSDEDLTQEIVRRIVEKAFR